MAEIQSNYLNSVNKQFQYYKLLGEKTFAQLEDHELFYQPHPTSNSIAIIVQHLWGNMMSRWTDFLTTDGEKQWRERDKEFMVAFDTRERLFSKWQEGWNCLFEALTMAEKVNLNDLVYIRNIGHTILEAINRQLAHYAYHVGQIVYIGTLIKGDQWQSLSIPRGLSEAYNKNKFSKAKHRGHFTEDQLKP